MECQHQEDCITKEEVGCFYYCCIQCEFYVSKKGKKEIYHKWDKKKKGTCKHVVISEKEYCKLHNIPDEDIKRWKQANK